MLWIGERVVLLTSFEFWIPHYLFEESLIGLVKPEQNVLQHLAMYLFVVFVVLLS